jgi:hypothetical protein
MAQRVTRRQIQSATSTAPAETELSADTPILTTSVTVVTAGQIAALVDISGKVDKVVGKQLSANDYTNEDKAKVAGVKTVAELVAAGKITGILGSGEIGVWDATTQANIAALVAEGWPLTHIIISYVAASGEPAAVTASNVSVTPSISAAELTGELPAASVSVSPTITTASLVGILAADNVSVTPAITEALLVSEGSVSADSVSVTPVISDAQLIGELLADNVSVTPTISEASLIGVLAADNASVTPQIGEAEAVGVLLADNVSVTPQISAAELTEESNSPVDADNVSVTPTVSTADLVGVLAANNVSVTPSIGEANLTEPGSLPFTDTFTRANSADLGADWADMGVSFTGIASNQASGVGNNMYVGGVLGLIDPDQYAQVKNGSPWVRAATNGDITGYHGVYGFDETEESNYYSILKEVDGVTSSVADVYVEGVDVTYLRLEVLGDSPPVLTLKHSSDGSSWTTFGSHNDPVDPILSGTFGFGNDSGTADDFEGGNQ